MCSASFTDRSSCQVLLGRHDRVGGLTRVYTGRPQCISVAADSEPLAVVRTLTFLDSGCYMRREFELGEVIAERQLVFEAAPGWTCDVIVKIGRPVPDLSAPHETWGCAFQIQGLGSGRVMGILGVDSMQ